MMRFSHSVESQINNLVTWQFKNWTLINTD